MAMEEGCRYEPQKGRCLKKQIHMNSIHELHVSQQRKSWFIFLNIRVYLVGFIFGFFNEKSTRSDITIT